MGKFINDRAGSFRKSIFYKSNILKQYKRKIGVIYMTFRYQGSVCSDLNDTKNFIENILDKVENIIKDDNLMFDLKLILNELIINGVVHGNESDREKCVDLYLEIKGDTLRIEVCDEGKGIDQEDYSYNPDDLRDCGRGLLLVNGLSDEVFIEKNRVVALKSI